MVEVEAVGEPTEARRYGCECYPVKTIRPLNVGEMSSNQELFTVVAREKAYVGAR